MMKPLQASERVFVNTGVLYVKVIFATIINLYLTRVVLAVLGVDDFGVYSLIAGVVNLLAFLSGTLMSSTQRFFSLAIGESDFVRLRRMFSLSVKMHWLFACTIFIVLELLMFVLFDGLLNIPANRIEAAKIVYQLMILSVFFTIITSPYNAALNAHEHLWFFAIVEIITSFFKLGLIFILSNANDALVFYTSWMLMATILNSIIKFFWCRHKYFEVYDKTKVRIKENLPLLKEMGRYVGWTSLSSFAVVGRDQGTAVVLNIFFTTAINSVVGIANQIRGLLMYFSQMMTASITPQIMESKGRGNNDRVLYLSVFACKLSFALSATLALPILLNIETVLFYWLKDVPEFTAIYCELVIVAFLVVQLYPGLVRAIWADGDVRNFQITISVLLLLPIIISPVMFYFGFIHYTIFYWVIIAEILSLIASAVFAHRLLHLKIIPYFGFVLGSACLFISFFVIGDNLHYLVSNALILIILKAVFITVLFVVIYYYLIFDKKEKLAIESLILRLVHKIK